MSLKNHTNNQLHEDEVYSYDETSNIERIYECRRLTRSNRNKIWQDYYDALGAEEAQGADAGADAEKEVNNDEAIEEVDKKETAPAAKKKVARKMGKRSEGSAAAASAASPKKQAGKPQKKSARKKSVKRKKDTKHDLFKGEGRVVKNGARVGKSISAVTKNKKKSQHKFIGKGRRLDGNDAVDEAAIAEGIVHRVKSMGVADEEVTLSSSDMGVEAVMALVKAGTGSQQILNEMAKIAHKQSVGYSRWMAADGLRFEMKPVNGGDYVDGGRLLGHGEEYSEEESTLHCARFTETYEGGRRFVDYFYPRSEEWVRETVRFYAMNCMDLLRQPWMCAAIPELLWNLVYYFQDEDEGVRTIIDMYEKAAPDCDFDTFKTNGRAAKARAKANKEAAKLQKAAKKKAKREKAAAKRKAEAKAMAKGDKKMVNK